MPIYDPAADPVLQELDGLSRALSALAATGIQAHPAWPRADGQPVVLTAFASRRKTEQTGGDWIEATRAGGAAEAAELAPYRAASEALTAQIERTCARLDPYDIVALHAGPAGAKWGGVFFGILAVDDLLFSRDSIDPVRALARLARWRAVRAEVLALGLIDPSVHEAETPRLGPGAPDAYKVWLGGGPRARSYAEGALLIAAGERILAGRIPTIDARLARDACEIPIAPGRLAPTARDRREALDLILAALAARELAGA